MKHGMPLAVREASRFEWVDVCRGLAMFLVIVHHGIITLASKAGIVAPTWLLCLNDFLLLFMMPTFSLISGLFMRNTDRKSNEVFWRERVGYFVYLYILWSIFYILMQLGRITQGMTATIDSLQKWVEISWGLNTGLWYLASLIFFYIYYRLTRSIKKIWHFIFIIPIYFLYSTDIVKTASWGWDHLLQYLIFFMIAAFWGHKILDFIPKISTLAYLIISVLLLGCFLTYAYYFYPVEYGYAELLLGPVAVLWFLKTCELLTNVPFANMWKRFGKITLPIYVLHVAVQEITSQLAAKIVPNGHMGAIEQFIIPLAIPITTTLISLTIWYLTKKPFWFIYDLPTFLKVRTK